MYKIIRKDTGRGADRVADAATIRNSHRKILRKHKMPETISQERLNEIMEASSVLNDLTNLPKKMQPVRKAIRTMIGERQLKLIPPGLLDQYVRALVYMHEASVYLDNMQPMQRQRHLRKYFALSRYIAVMARSANITQSMSLAVMQAEIANEMSDEIHSTDLNAWKKEAGKQATS